MTATTAAVRQQAVIVIFYTAELRAILSACDLNIVDIKLQLLSDLETTTVPLDMTDDRTMKY